MWLVKASRIAEERAIVCTQSLLKEKGNKGAELAVYSAIFAAAEEGSGSSSRASRDGRSWERGSCCCCRP